MWSNSREEEKWAECVCTIDVGVRTKAGVGLAAAVVGEDVGWLVVPLRQLVAWKAAPEAVGS
jgi:hypothetical protein